MASIASHLWRALIAVPFLLIARICYTHMDFAKLKAYHTDILNNHHGTINWDGGSLTVFSEFYGVKKLDNMWRGPAVCFSPSSLGYDGIAWWQMLAFLTDLGPLYAVWLLESARCANAWTPAYFATFFTFTAQLIGIGNVAPVFYFLSLALGPTTADLARNASNRAFNNKYTVLLLPLMLVLHNLEVLAAYLLPSPEARHYWVWAWQMSPLWIGIANVVGGQLFGNLSPTGALSGIGRSQVTLVVLSTISALVWAAVLVLSPYPSSQIFVPALEEQTDLVLHTRKALQFDQVSSFGASFLWLAYQFIDLYREGLIGAEGLWQVAVLPVVGSLAGPGVAFALGWYWREQKLSGHGAGKVSSR